jgi:hypothetical protein
VPGSPGRHVIPLGEYLLHPLHDFRQLKPVFRLDIKHKPVLLDPQTANRETKPKHGLLEHPGENGQGFGAAEEGFPVVDTGTDFVPHILSEFT